MATTSPWLSEAPFVIDSNELPAECDTVIIGAGMTGCSTALHLARKQSNAVVVLDARVIAGGATGRNGGLCWPQGDGTTSESAFEHGVVQELQEFMKEQAVECELRHGGGVHLEWADGAWKEATEPAEGDQSATEDVQVWSAPECEAMMGTSAFRRGYFSSRALQLWPARLTQGIASAAIELGVSFFEHCKVHNIAVLEVGPHRWRVETSSGQAINCCHVVVATNGWAPRLVPSLSPSLYAVRNQVILTEPLPVRLWSFGFAVGDGADEIYGMQRPDGRVLVGGSRSSGPNKEVGVDDDGALDPGVSAALREFLSKFPALAGVAVEREWSGVLGFTTSGKPIVGELEPGLFVGVGFCGHGMPRCWGVGKSLAELIAGQEPSVLPASLLKSYAPPAEAHRRK